MGARVKLSASIGNKSSIFPVKSVSNKIPTGPNKNAFFRFCWWNGGGNIRMRLRTNPELRRLISTKPDVFIYGEAETPSPQNLELTDYVCYLHKSKLEIDGHNRRGLTIFYRTKYHFLFTIKNIPLEIRTLFG